MENKVLVILNEIIESKGKERLKTLNPALSLRDDLGLTSLDLATLTVNIEDEFDIDVFEDGLVATVGEILEKLK